MHTPWGYQVDELPPLISDNEFAEASGYKWSGDPRAGAAIAAASAAIRNECGWHIAPSLECHAVISARGRIAELPANLVTEVSKVTENGLELEPGQFEPRMDGLMRRCGFRNWTTAWGGIDVEYTAGYDMEAVPDLTQAVVSVVEAVLAIPTGVQSESAGGVSVSYAASAASVAGAMTGQLKSALAPYKLVSSHAA